MTRLLLHTLAYTAAVIAALIGLLAVIDVIVRWLK